MILYLKIDQDVVKLRQEIQQEYLSLGTVKQLAFR